MSDGSVDGRFVGNTVQNYRIDGARVLSNNTYFADNDILDCYDVDDNHDDGIQSYSVTDEGVGTGVVKNVIIRGNVIIASTDPGNPLAGNPQGIGCFDGFFENWTVENNLIVSSTWHGISLYGLRDSAILNNSVIDQDPDNDPSPWIMIHAHKDERPSTNSIAANNIVSNTVSISGNNVSESNNYRIGKSNYILVYSLFSDPDNNDYSLQDNLTTRSSLIDQGEYMADYYSSEYDLLNSPRDGFPDLGAYEFSQ